MKRDAFQAIADPTRRQILTLISGEALNLNSIADNFSISRPAISKHVRILEECGIVVIRQEGRERYCEARPEKLAEVSDWLEEYRQMWMSKLDALEKYLDTINTKTKNHGKSSKRRKR